MARCSNFLVVDSDAASSARLARFLERSGFPTVACTEPGQAWTLAGRTQFDLALVDFAAERAAALCRRLLALPVPLRSVLFAPTCVQSDLDRAFSSGAVGFHHGPDLAARLLADVRLFCSDSWDSIIPRSGGLGRGREVLVIDDDSHISAAAGYELAAAGFAVTLAADGRNGLLAAARRRPHAVLLDVNLPDRRLEEMVPALKADPAGPALLLWTGLDGAAHERRFVKLGADDFTVKTVHPLDSLALRVDRILGRPRVPAGSVAFGRLRLDRAERKVWVDEREVATLTGKEFIIVEAAALGGTDGVRWRDLDSAVDGRPEDACPDSASGGVRAHLNHAREKLAGSGVELRTVPGFGLRLEVAR